MSVVKELYELQEIDLELKANEQALDQVASQIGETEDLIKARARLALEQQLREELNQQQRAIEWEIDDIASKITAAEEELYSGRIRNPKELANLQHEIEVLKTKRLQLEDKVLEIMARLETAAGNIATLGEELREREAEWRAGQQRLSAKLEHLKTVVSDLKQMRQQAASGIDPQLVELYSELKKQKGTAVARIEQGICCGCRISLSVSELQRVRSGNPVRCSSCGRILFLA